MAQKKQHEGRDILDDPELFVGADDESDRESRRTLLEHLVSAGASVDLLKAAAHEGRLTTLPVEFALKGEPRYTLTEVAAKAGLDSRYLRSVVLSLGHVNPRQRERTFTEEDVEVAMILRRFLDAGLRRSDVLDMSRVIGQSMARIAATSREVVGNRLIHPGDSEADIGIRLAAAAGELAPLLGSVLGYELSVHLREQATREVITHAERARGAIAGTREVAVCFADLSDFTRLGERVPAERVGSIGSRMATVATHVAEHPVELVKTVGDGALFVSPEVTPLIGAARELRDRIEAEGEDFPSARAGIAFGDAVSRGGDWFGAPVNRASRIVDIAKPGTILVEETIRERAADGYRWARRRWWKRLRGVEGRVKLYRLDDRGGLEG